MQILKRGDTNLVKVERVRDILEAQGFYEPSGKPGTFNAALEDAVIYFQQTHLGQDGKPLLSDGMVGPATWWALRHPTGRAQRSGLNPFIPGKLGHDRTDVLLKALTEHGKNVRERPNGSNRSKEIDKYLPKWWLDKHGPEDKGPAWCCFFVHWCFHEALGMWPCLSRTGSCSQLMKMAQDQDDWYTAEQILYGNCGKLIRPGDIFIIAHPKKPGKPATGHTGFVLRVNEDQTKVNTLEGNCGNRVKCGVRDVKDLTGFINPYSPDHQPDNFRRSLLDMPSMAGATTR